MGRNLLEENVEKHSQSRVRSKGHSARRDVEGAAVTRNCEVSTCERTNMMEGLGRPVVIIEGHFPHREPRSHFFLRASEITQ